MRCPFRGFQDRLMAGVLDEQRVTAGHGYGLMISVTGDPGE